MNKIYKQLRDKTLITAKQFDFLTAVESGKIVSVHAELRILLYLGILLFTGGAGYIAYENIGSIGHIVLMLALCVIIFFCFRFINKLALPYSNEQVEIKHNYYDYILLLAGLVIIALFTYIQIYFDLVAMLLNWTSVISASIFFFMTYRYDNKALLSIAITLLAAAVGISMSPMGWLKGDFIVGNYVNVSILLGLALIATGALSKSKMVKAHFEFTYQNFGILLFFFACVSSIFMDYMPYLFAGITCATAALLAYYSWSRRLFLFFLYAAIAGYIALTYLLFAILADEAIVLLIYYIPISCIGFIIFLIQKKSHFSND